MKTFDIPSPAALCGYGEDTPLLLALSGGADSRLLLHLLAAMAAKTGAVLYAAHVHHGIRGDEADRDEAFCRALCERYGVPLLVAHVDAPRAARESGESLEEAARRLRYGCLAAWMRERGIPLLVTAHHADDNLETVLLRLCRGTGLRGLGGIAPVRPLPEAASEAQTYPPMLVRPLLAYSKQDVLDACTALSLDFVTDSTNADLSCDRNLLRASVTPVLRRLTDRPERQVLRACESLREDEAYLTEQATALLAEASQGDALLRAHIASAHPALARRALRLWLASRTGKQVTAQRLASVLALCQRGGTSHSLDIGGGRCVSADRHLVFVHPKADAVCAQSYTLTLTEGEQVLDGMTVRLVPLTDGDAHATVTPASSDSKNVYDPFIRDTLTFDTIVPYAPDKALVLRSRAAGDTIYLRGLHRKLRKLHNEHGIPPVWRERLPVLCDGEGILWAPAIGLRDGVTDAPTHRLSITLYPKL